MPQIHQEVVLHTTPKRIYEALTMRSSSVRFSGGAPADISAEVGSSFSCFGGLVLGRNIELIPNPRVVQAWRAKPWESGVYSIVKFELREEGAGTRVIFDQTGFPPEQQEHLEGGWQTNYWEPLRKHFAWQQESTTSGREDQS